MSKRPTPVWPKTREGEVDWQAVFENPEDGYIPRVQRASDPHALRAAVLVAIESLFSRKEDRADVKEFAAKLEKIFATGGLKQTKEAVTTLMRGIKDQRIEKSAQHAAKVRAGKKTERRLEGDSRTGLTMVPFKALGLNKREAGILFGTLFAALFACVLGVGLLIGLQYIDQLFDEKPKAKEPKVTHVTAPEDKPDRPKKDIITQPSEDVAYEFRVDAPPLFMSIKPDGKRSTRLLYLPTLYLMSDEERLTLCRNWPKVLDALNVTLSRIHPVQEKASAKRLAKANRLAAKVINQTIGLDLVTWVSFVLLEDPSQITGRSTKACVVERTRQKAQ